MEFAFYAAALIAVLATLRVITHTNPVHALLYLIVSLLAIACVFFSLGAYFAGALEIIVYAGAIMVLFVFVVMMLNLGSAVAEQEKQWLKPSVWIGPGILSLLLLAVIIKGIYSVSGEGIQGSMLLSAAASSFLLFGMALVYAGSGDLSFASLGKSLSDQQLYQPLLLAGLGMMIVGIGFKLSLAPFHLWTPDVYQGAPAPVSTFLATASKIAIFGAVMRLFLYAPLVDGESVRLALAVVAFVSIIVGNVMAVAQTNIKRLLGYSSIAHMGYLLVALIAVQSHQLALETVGVYLVGYLFSSLGAFGVVSLISSPYRGADEDSLAAYRGLFWRRPVLAASMSVMMLSLAGIPMTLGFFGKFYVLAVSVNAQLWWLTAAVVVGSAIGLYYYLRAMVNLYLSKPPAQVSGQNEAAVCPFSLGGVVVVLSAIIVVALGLYPQPLISLVQMAQPLM